VLKRALPVETSVVLIYECNRKQLQSSVLFEDEELAQRIADVLMLHCGGRLDDLGRLEVLSGRGKLTQSLIRTKLIAGAPGLDFETWEGTNFNPPTSRSWTSTPLNFRNFLNT
jgi:hypothetical protein